MANKRKLQISDNRNLLITLLLVGAGILFTLGVLRFFRVDFWIMPPAKKLAIAWNDDLNLIEKSGKLPREWYQIKDISITADNSQIQDWLKQTPPPIHKDPKGKYRLQVFLTQWIEGYRYGVLIQYHLVDLSNQNTIWEDGRTFKLGFIY